MKVDLKYPILMAVVGLLIGWFISILVFGVGSPALNSASILNIIIPSAIAFAIIGFLWGSKK